MIDLLIKGGRIFGPGRTVDSGGDFGVTKGRIVDFGLGMVLKPKRP